MNEGEKLDRFCAGLKPQVRLEVPKANPGTGAKASKFALNVDNALVDAGISISSWYGAYCGLASPSQGYQRTDIRNVARNPHKRAQSFKGKWNETKTNDSQRQRDLQKSTCFLCLKTGCGPWKHVDAERQRFATNNVQAGGINESSDSEPGK